MLPIYNSDLLKAWDQFSIKSQGISSSDLMERASIVFTDWFIKTFSKNTPVFIFCGNGNNGGDGLAIARLLYQKSFSVKVIIIPVSLNDSIDFKLNLEKIKTLPIETYHAIDHVSSILKDQVSAIVIDAVLGYGFNKPLQSNLLALVNFINSLHLPVVSVDIPSGMYVYKITTTEFVHASHTFTFQSPKLCQLIPETGKYCGELHIGNIQLDEKFVESNPSQFNFMERLDIASRYKPRNPFGYKNNYGHLLIIGGQKGMAGAIILSATAALKSGCGLCSVCSIEENRKIIQIGIPEVIYIEQEQIDLSKYSCVAIGPGLGVNEYSKKLVSNLLGQSSIKLILDADALNIISQENWQSRLHSNCIITPHVGEFDRLFGICKDGFERIEKAKMVSGQYEIHIVLKGKYSAIINPANNVYFNTTGNAGLSKAGSGDVLTGILGSFLAQGYSETDACIMAAYFHGFAADLVNKEIAQESILATDVIDKISDAFKHICL